MAILFSTDCNSSEFLKDLNSLKVTRSKFIKMRMLAPKTAILLGVIPHSVILNMMAESAIPFTIIVTTERARSSKIPVLLDFLSEDSATENRIIAITPIRSILKTKHLQLK